MNGNIKAIILAVVLGGAILGLGFYMWKDSQQDPECMYCKQFINRDKLMVHQWSCPKNPGSKKK